MVNVITQINIKSTNNKDIALLILKALFLSTFNFCINKIIFLSKKLIGIFKRNAKTIPNITGKVIATKLSMVFNTNFKLCIMKNNINPYVTIKIFSLIYFLFI